MKLSSTIPFYDPLKSYEENYQHGPFGLLTMSARQRVQLQKKHQFLGLPVNVPFGIPAGPLLNSKFVTAAFRWGFDLCTYKTVRTCAKKSHALPNVLAVHPSSRGLTGQNEVVLADQHYSLPLSITNSFGVPSFSPDIWQPDMQQAVNAAGKGQYLIGSFQGTSGQGKIEEDYALAAKLVAETGVSILEANLSCPNEGKKNMLCFDIDSVERIVYAIKNQQPDLPLILKIAYFHDDILQQFMARIGPLIQGVSAINTLPAKLVDKKGNPALIDRTEGGVCGDAIRWAGLDMVNRLAAIRKQLQLSFSIIGVGGVNSKQRFNQYMALGADAVMSATGAMWDPHLALDISDNIN